jgi:CRISPR-associated protein Csx10
MSKRIAFALRLAMRSDWHVGNGAGRPGDVDKLVARDATGLPFLPAKTVVGIWRDECERLLSGLDDGKDGRWSRWIAVLFGNEPGRAGADPLEAPRPAALSVRPARIAAPIRDRLKGAGGHLRAAVTFVKPGVMIDPDTGSARDDFLRMEEIARGGLELIADCELDVEGWREAQRRAATNILAAAASMIERLGGKRRRGHGRCSALADGPGDLSAALDWLDRTREPPNPPSLPSRGLVEAGPPSDPGSGWSALALRLTLDTPVVVPAATVGNVIESLDYIPGSFLLPIVARLLNDLGMSAEAEIAADNVLVLPATLEVAGERGLPAPMALFRPKTPKPDAHPLAEARNRFVEQQDDGAQLQPLRGGYLGSARAGELPDFSQVNLIVNTHGTIDDEAQRPTAAVGGVFSYGAIAAGTILRSEIRLRQGLAARLAEKGDWWRSLEGVHRVGRSKKDDYGRVNIELPSGGPVPLRSPSLEPGSSSDELKLWLLSDLLVRNEDLKPESTLAALCRLLSEALPGTWAITQIPPKDGLVRAEVRVRRHDGWQVQWGLPRPSLVGFQAGSCLWLKLERPVSAEELAALEAASIGERRAEGFGQIRFNDPLLEQPMQGRQSTRSDGSAPLRPLPPIAAGDADHSVAACIERAAWRAAIAERALAIGLDPKQREEALGFTSEMPEPSQLGALRSKIARIQTPEAGDGPLTQWLSRVKEHRRDKWPNASIGRLRALIADQNAVWHALRLNVDALTADAKPRLEKELWSEAIVALIGAAVRGQVLDLRAEEAADA